MTTRAVTLRALPAFLLPATGAAWLLAASATAEAPADAPPGSIRFVGENLLARADGRFHRWRYVAAEIEPSAPERSAVEVEIDVASLDTGIERRDEHLRSPDFFDVERWPTARVRVHDVRRDGESDAGRPRYRATFDLRIRDVERSLVGRFELVEREPPTVEGELTIDRVAFGIGEAASRWNPLSIREEVPVRFRARLPVAGVD